MGSRSDLSSIYLEDPQTVILVEVLLIVDGGDNDSLRPMIRINHVDQEIHPLIYPNLHSHLDLLNSISCEDLQLAEDFHEILHMVTPTEGYETHHMAALSEE